MNDIVLSKIVIFVIVVGDFECSFFFGVYVVMSVIKVIFIRIGNIFIFFIVFRC